MLVSIYQIKPNTAMRCYFSFEDNRSLFDMACYEKVWTTEKEHDYSLQNCFEEFNVRMPYGYPGRSLSVSDIVQLDQQFFYCENFGWLDITEHAIKSNKKKNLAMTLAKAESNAFSNKLYKESIQKNLEKYLSDSRKKQRLSSNECKTCFYLKTQIAGQAFTSYACYHCGQHQLHHNTAVPRYCAACSSELGVCRRCGAFIDEEDAQHAKD